MLLFAGKRFSQIICGLAFLLLLESAFDVTLLYGFLYKQKSLGIVCNIKQISDVQLHFISNGRHVNYFISEIETAYSRMYVQ